MGKAHRGSLPVLLAFPGNDSMASALARQLPGEPGELELDNFPDGESAVRIGCDVHGRTVLLVCTLDRPDSKLLPLVFAADAARDLGAARVGLVSPYLAYMRQDKRFRDGEAVSSAHFARILSQHFDHITTVDPHLHRRTGLGEIFSIPTYVAHAAPLLADWIAANIERPLIIGPDVESEQWAAEVAAREALERSAVDPADLDLVIIGTLTPDYHLPSCAVLVQDRLGASKAGAFEDRKSTRLNSSHSSVSRMPSSA